MAIKGGIQPAKRKISPITIENAQMIYKNFAGIGKKFNAKGLRNFNVILDLKTAAMLLEDGWNIKYREPKEEGDDRQARLKVSVRFDNFPPRIVLITKDGGRAMLDEESVDILDHAEIKMADIEISGSAWVNAEDGDSGIKAYLKKGFFTLSENDLESKYQPVSRRKDDVED